MGEKGSKQKPKYDRGWKLAKQAARNCNKSFEAKIKQTREKEIEVTITEKILISKPTLRMLSGFEVPK